MSLPRATAVAAALLLTPLLLYACAPAQPPPATTAATGCAAADAAWAIGQPASAEARSRALRDSGARRLRVIGFGQMHTMDYDPDRLNLELDEAGRIARVRCG